MLVSLYAQVYICESTCVCMYMFIYAHTQEGQKSVLGIKAYVNMPTIDSLISYATSDPYNHSASPF